MGTGEEGGGEYYQSRARVRLIRRLRSRKGDFVSGMKLDGIIVRLYEADDEITKRKVNDVSTALKGIRRSSRRNS